MIFEKELHKNFETRLLTEEMSASNIQVRTKTTSYKNCIDSDRAWCLYYALEEGLPWAKTIKSKGKPTRFGYALGDDIDPHLFYSINTLLNEVLDILKIDKSRCRNVYFNYYQNGNDFTPGHSHETDQVIISLGATRTLTIGKRKFPMNNGDVIVFGKSDHSVPKEPWITEGRISIALFLER